ncbi:MAG: hypothetical protein S4CHLAM81_00520 [Chlamydiales bacterium]|nr:hypothetical protein [Chlamydiales bacterium]MCH9634854.1 hypothetical protein [Chlamydiales bacterium]MCH9704077.1 hypothetical protein [Chlamydiota bacterium]
MYHIRIGDSYWSVDRTSGHIAADQSNEGAEDLSRDPVFNHNANYLITHRSTSSCKVDEKGRLQRSWRSHKVTNAVTAVFGGMKTEGAKCFFYYLLQDSKIENKHNFFRSTSNQLDIIVDNVFWSVNKESGFISKEQPLHQRVQGVASYNLTEWSSEVGKHNLKKILTRKKGSTFYADSKGKLHRGVGNQERVKIAVNCAMAMPMRHVDRIKDEDTKRALSHFLYSRLNREGSVGVLSKKVHYIGAKGDRVCNRDMTQNHVDIVIGDHFWRVDTENQTISRALPTADRHSGVESIDLGGSKLINNNLKELFERRVGGYFQEKRGRLQRVRSLRSRISYWRNKKEERERVRNVVTQALSHLDNAVNGHDEDALKFFLRKKLQGSGQLAQMKVEHFDRSCISHGGGIEKLLKHDLEAARADLKAKLRMLKKYSHHEKRAVLERSEKERRGIELGTQEKLQRIRLDGQLMRYIEAQLVEKSKGDLEQELEASKMQMAEVLLRRYVRFSVVESRGDDVDRNKVQEMVTEHVHYMRCRIAKQQAKDAHHELLIQEFLFAQSIGVKLKTVGDGGSGGARYAFSRKGKKILVVKPDDEGPYGRNNPRFSAYIKQFFLKIRSCLAENSEPVTEVSSFNMDRGFDLNIVPSTSVRRLESGTFVKIKSKWCSVQAYVDGCKPMQAALGLDSDRSLIKAIKSVAHSDEVKGRFAGLKAYFRNLRNDLLWKVHQNFLSRESVAKSFEEEGVFAENLQEVIGNKEEAFQRAFSRFVIHNFLIGDTDCHFDNWFVKKKKVEDTALVNLMKGKEIDFDHFVDVRLFDENIFYQLHDALFHDEEGFMIIKHDGGSSMPRRHPTSKFEVRLAYLFEVLPGMKEVFSQEIRELFQDGDRSAYETIAMIAIHNLVNITTADDFHTFWNDLNTRSSFKKWLFMADDDREAASRTALAASLSRNHTGRDKVWRHWHYNGHLRRIKGIVSTFRDRWEALNAHLLEKPADKPEVWIEGAKQAQNKSMRRLTEIKRRKDFREFRTGHSINPAYNKRMELFDDRLVKWTRDPVVDSERHEDYATLQQLAPQLVRDLG